MIIPKVQVKENKKNVFCTFNSFYLFTWRSNLYPILLVSSSLKKMPILIINCM